MIKLSYMLLMISNGFPTYKVENVCGNLPIQMEEAAIMVVTSRKTYLYIETLPEMLHKIEAALSYQEVLVYPVIDISTGFPPEKGRAPI